MPKMSMNVEPGYEALFYVLQQALEQAQHGKGKIRHAEGKPFTEQDICQLAREEGRGFARGQARKKLKEALRLEDGEQRIHEELGAINFICADIILTGEMMSAKEEGNR